jgi:segregation and condensation protein B
LLGTTREFLDYFGLKSLDNLPTLAQLRDVENLGVQLEFPETQPAVAAADALAAEAAADEPTEAVPVAEEGVPDELSIEELAVDENAPEDGAAVDGAADGATSVEPN